MFIIRKYIVGNKLFCFMLVTVSRASMWAHHHRDAITSHHNAGNMEYGWNGKAYSLAWFWFLRGYDDEIIMCELPLKLIKRTIVYKINCGLLMRGSDLWKDPPPPEPACDSASHRSWHGASGDMGGGSVVTTHHVTLTPAPAPRSSQLETIRLHPTRAGATLS